MDEYIKRFEELKTYMIGQNKGGTEEYFIESFLSGLKKEIANALYLVKPQTLRDAINQARRQEVYLESLDKRTHGISKPVESNPFQRGKPSFAAPSELVQPSKRSTG